MKQGSREVGVNLFSQVTREQDKRKQHEVVPGEI